MLISLGDINFQLASMLNTTVDDIEFHQFATFLASYEKLYPSEMEYKKRFRVFRANLKKIKYLQDTEQGTGQYGATHFADLTSMYSYYLFCSTIIFRGNIQYTPSIPKITRIVLFPAINYLLNSLQ